MDVVAPGPTVPPVLIGAKVEVHEVELAKGGSVLGEVPLETVLRGSNELALVPLGTVPVPPVEIGPTVLVEFALKVVGTLEVNEGSV